MYSLHIPVAGKLVWEVLTVTHLGTARSKSIVANGHYSCTMKSFLLLKLAQACAASLLVFLLKFCRILLMTCVQYLDSIFRMK
ncbi:hypothetical protein S83_066446 [Arachis hypogaea]